MSEHSGASTLVAMTLEEPGSEQASPRAQGPVRCGPCAVWPRQQTWLCAVPLVMGFVGLGLSLMLLKWIVVGSVQDYVPTDLVDPKGSMGQDPIFLSKPSAVPKGPDVSATVTAGASSSSSSSTTTQLPADGTAPAPRTRSGPPANHSANGSVAGGDSNANGNRAPHLHNRVGTRVSGTTTTTTTATTTTTRFTRLAPPGGKEVTPHNTARKNSGGSGRNGASNSKPGQPAPTVGTAASTTPSVATATAKSSSTKMVQPTSQPSAPAKPTSRWNHGRPTKGPVTRPHHRYRTPVAPTTPSLRSEVFKPCVEDKDLAFCLNEGECSIIETVAGVHRHCRCKEGYHGLRCDQFVPKTDAILSDPTDELGIEFMESGETYQRQVLSIFSIASGICLLSVACMALYRRNKRHREKLRAHFSESRSLRDCSINASGLMSKSTARTQYKLQLQKNCSSPVKGVSMASGISTAAPPILRRALSKEKCFRSSSLSLSPAQQRRETTCFRTPPISRGKHSLVEGSRVSGHVYKHLQEAESTDMEGSSLTRCDSTTGRLGALLSRPSLSHFAARKGWAEVPCTRLDKGTAIPPSSLCTRSVPIIPSLQARGPDGGCRDRAAHPTLATKSPVEPRSCSPSPAFLPHRETAALANGITPGGVTHPAVTDATPSPGSWHTPAPRAAEPEGALKVKSLSIPVAAVGSSGELPYGATDTLTAGTELDSKGKRTRYRPRPLNAGGRPRGQGAACQGEAHGLCQGQTANSPGSRVPESARARPSAS